MKRVAIRFCLVVAVGLFGLVGYTKTVSAQNLYNCANQSVISFVECQALVDLYISTNGSERNNNSYWLVVNNPCKWYGVSCSSSFSTTAQQLHVRQLRLTNNNLVGAMPASIGDLQWLQRIDLSNNLMCGMLPETLTSLVNLVSANFSYNNFLTAGYSPAMLAFLNQSFVTWLPQSNPQACGSQEPVAELTIFVDNGDDETEDPKYVVGGYSLNAVPFVSAFEFIADYGDVIVHDLTLLTDGPGAGDFNEAVLETVIYDEDLVTVIGSQAVISNSEVVFDGIELDILEGVKTIFVKVVADFIGDEYDGTPTDDITFSLVATDVEDANVGGSITPVYDGVGQTLESTVFMIVAAKFNDADFVLAAAGNLIDTSISNGYDLSIAILQLTAATWANTQISPAGSLEILVNELKFESTNTNDITNYEIRRIGNGPTTYIPCAIQGAFVTCDLTSSNTATKEFISGETGYYIVRADVDAPSNTSVKLSLDNLNGGSPAPIEYEMSDGSYTYTQLRIGIDYMESTAVAVIN